MRKTSCMMAQLYAGGVAGGGNPARHSAPLRSGPAWGWSTLRPPADEGDEFELVAGLQDRVVFLGADQAAIEFDGDFLRGQIVYRDELRDGGPVGEFFGLAVYLNRHGASDSMTSGRGGRREGR